MCSSDLFHWVWVLVGSHMGAVTPGIFAAMPKAWRIAPGSDFANSRQVALVLCPRVIIPQAIYWVLETISTSIEFVSPAASATAASISSFVGCRPSALAELMTARMAA